MCRVVILVLKHALFFECVYSTVCFRLFLFCCVFSVIYILLYVFSCLNSAVCFQSLIFCYVFSVTPEVEPCQHCQVEGSDPWKWHALLCVRIHEGESLSDDERQVNTNLNEHWPISFNWLLKILHWYWRLTEECIVHCQPSCTFILMLCRNLWLVLVY